MPKRVFVDLKVRLVIDVNEGVDVQEVIDELDYDFTSTMEGAAVNDSAITDSNITETK